MNLHQVLTGACNAGDHCFAVGSVEGIPFTAYAAGCDIVILASNYERVQIIPGICHGNIQVVCLDCSTDRGKIAAAYGNQVCILEPTPLLNHNKSHKLDYYWVQTGSFFVDFHIHNLSWNSEGHRLLIGGESIQLWNYNLDAADELQGLERNSCEADHNVHFQIGGDEGRTEKENPWTCIWKCKTASPVFHLKFSPDGSLFASAGKADRLVKIWYESRPVGFPIKNFDVNNSTSSLSNSTVEEVNYGFIYIAHPRAVTGLSWRKTSKYMPKGSVSNMLVTSCYDNICRIWIQTVLPDDGLVNMQQFDPMGTQNPRHRMQQHKQRFMVRLKHMKTCFHFRRRQATQHLNFSSPISSAIPTLPSTFSTHDFHSYGVPGFESTPGFHFHLSTSINAETDIPLVPSISRRDSNKEPNFVLHWLNNKEMHFTLCAEQILQDLFKKAIQQDQPSRPSEEQDNCEVDEASNGHEDEFDSKDSTSHKKKNRKKSSRVTIHKVSSKAKAGVDDGDSPGSSSFPSTVSSSSISTDASMGTTTPLGDALDHKIEMLLQDWHRNPDLLFSIHPVDGSFLVWIVEWLDEYGPGIYRQSQVSFSSRIPNALPLGDAMSMSSSLALYNCKSALDLKTMLDAADGQLSPGGTKKMNDFVFKPVDDSIEPLISMVTKHKNGTLNLWNLTFSETTKFTHVLSVGHQARVCGHRFRVNDITCHPVLPLLLTTSHHNIPKTSKEEEEANVCTTERQPFLNGYNYSCEEDPLHSGFCSELILWRIDSVGPLCMSGGVTELARINSPKTTAFANVAWIPTLLPSTTLGSISNSPSACFVASDGQCLRVYQAVIDARTLLSELFSAQRKKKMTDESICSLSSSSSMDMGMKPTALQDAFRIVSQQSTARPGCIMELDAITDATHDWQNTQLLHVFQEQLITGEKGCDESKNLMEPTLGAIVDLHHTTIFEEPFYLVVLEKKKHTVLHMWRIVISSQPAGVDDEDGIAYAPDSDIIQEGDRSSASSGSNSPGVNGVHYDGSLASPVSITTSKVCTQTLVLPDDVEVVYAAPAAGHLSSSSIYPACFAPYLISTACSDGSIRFWRCNVSVSENEPPSTSYEWMEWEMMINNERSSTIDVSGTLLNVSCAYSGRIACAYKHGKSFTRPHSDNPNSRYVNICVAIYECESTGGSEWILEDTIHLRNISLPEITLDVDLRYLYDKSLIERKMLSFSNLVRTFSHDEQPNTFKDGESDHLCNNLHGLLAVPSFSTLQTLRKAICEKGNQFALTQKHLVQLDWVSTEDGSHILTVGVGSEVLLFTAVGSDLAQNNLKAMNESRKGNRPILKKASSMAAPTLNTEVIRWMKVRSISLKTADGLPPLPMQISWVRDGLLVVGMDNEMHVYSQWKNPNDLAAVEINNKSNEFQESIDHRTLTDLDLINLVQETAYSRVGLGKSLSHASSANLVSGLDAKKKRELISKGIVNNDATFGTDLMLDYGLFEASRIACPVLPQYHPKQLMELLNFGKIRRVKAILAHLVRCLAGSNAIVEAPNTLGRTGSNSGSMPSHQRNWSRSRTVSISLPTRASPLDPSGVSSAIVSEDVQLDYVEINAIPPLPLFTLLAADKEASAKDKERNKGYQGLFDGTIVEPAESLDDILAEDFADGTVTERRRSLSGEQQSLSNFGSRQARILTQLLTHNHLPGLSSLDQMHLLAVADTVATFNNEFSDTFTARKTNELIPHSNELQTGVSADSLDDCGLRFLLAMQHHSYLLRCLPIVQRTQLQRQGISSANLVWAFHSESEEDLLNMIPGMQRGNPKWSEMREMGVGWWLSSNAILKRCIEKVAKAAFQQKNNPMDATLFYLALKKKNILWGLFRSVRDEKMTAFFQHDFNEERWRKAALKNAFALLGKQRFEHAAAFFLLSGSLSDAVEVCMTKLDDFQLAMVVIRLYEGDMDSCPSSLKKLLYVHLLGCDPDGSNYQPCSAHPDPFLRSKAYWILKDYQNALETLLQTQIGSEHPKATDDDARWYQSSISANPTVFNFYLYLRTHPLLIRHQLVESSCGVVLSGFSQSTENGVQLSNKQVLLEDTITPLERRLYFTSAHAHFKAGCPALALEVLSKLPSKVANASTRSPSMVSSDINQVASNDRRIDTGNLDWGLSWTATPTIEEELDITLSNDEDDEIDFKVKTKLPEDQSTETGVPDGAKPQLDIMAQQLKFVACLKIVMDELSNLATGFEVDGGQLRYQLYVWLEQEVDALKELCNYGSKQEVITGESGDICKLAPSPAFRSGEKPTLHEILLQDKMDFEAKLKRAERRRRWLRDNQTLLRTLLSYCCLHGASGGGLASVRMELILLLQELHQEKTQRQLLSPLPFPTTLPLLSASVACHKTVVTDPIRHLQAMTHDVLHTIVGFHKPPIPGCSSLSEVFILRDLSIALAACIYQSLCDSESFSVKQSGFLSAGMESLASSNVVYHDSHLMAAQTKRRRFSSSEDPLQASTPPNKWPGVTSLRALLAREKDEDAPKLNTLLCETFISVYMSLLVHSLATCEAHTLYRLVGQKFTEQTWATLFGGGAKRLLKVSVNNQGSNPQAAPVEKSSAGEISLLTTLSKQRAKFHQKLFAQGSQPAPIKEDRPTYREQFVPPDMSMVSCLMSKPHLPLDVEIDYDSSESVHSEDEDEDTDDDDLSKTGKVEDCNQHSDPNSYSWCILRYAIVKRAKHYIEIFLNVAGLELQELPVASPLIHSVLRVLDHWLINLKDSLDKFGGPPLDFIPGCIVEKISTGPAIQKYRSILDSRNTPFKSKRRLAEPLKRLWLYLVRQEDVQEIFIRYIFSRRKQTLHVALEDNTSADDIDSDHPLPDPIRIIHKDQDSISAFCISKINNGIISLATTKEVQELDISVLLEPPSWLEDSCEFDILNLRGTESVPAADYLVVQTSVDRPMLVQMQSTSQTGSTANSAFSSPTGSTPSTFMGQTGRATTVLMKHKVEGVRRMSSHPLLPVYLSGSQDGSVRLWEWGHNQPLSTPRPPGTYAKVTRARFNPQGNKFGVSDGDGNLSLWQVGMSSSSNKSFFSVQSHNKQTSDFVFLASSSLLATAGHSSESKNVCIFDTLLPQKKSLVQAFTCHEQGSSCITYAPQHQVLISAGKKGFVCIFDVRQRQLRHRFQAHESAIKCIALDPAEEYFVTGSADGDIKVWGLALHNVFFSFPGEHTRNTFFRNISVGVTQLHVDSNNRLFSCGADGSMKLRQLPERELIVSYY
ncbi:hypothetical protein CHUAL_011029 [Chamberlinius hualienensis]